VQVFRSSDLKKFPFAYQRDSIRDREGIFLIVRHEQGRDADAVKHRPQLVASRLSERWIEIGERLIHQENLGLDHQRPRKRDALLLTSR
jgi:hypothetical protein